MSDKAASPEQMRLLAAQAGLERAWQLFPDGVRAAAERGLRPLGAPPAGTSPIALPASIFDATRFERDR